MITRDVLIDDFTHPLFAKAFQAYFEEMGETVRDWPRMFNKMNADPHGRNYAYLRTEEGGSVVGFIQFTALDVTSWFFHTQIGFVREFWVAPTHRGRGHGRALLALAEDHFIRSGLFASILTTGTAEGFYARNGYVRIDAIQAENGETVMAKRLLLPAKPPNGGAL